jgi:uncharacterized protein YgbK (DUF1537 family)
MIRVGIVADDLTGAADTAVQFVRAGWETELQLRIGRSEAAVIALTTESRGQSVRQSADAVSGAVSRLRGAKVTHLYKKIDSTLRGQISAEVHAAVESWSAHAAAVVCPAYPAMGRTVVDGQLLVNGVRVTETSVALDPITPVLESHIPTLVHGTHLMAAAGESARQLADRINASGAVVVADAVSEGDMRHLAEAVGLLGPDAIPVGSAGLARHMAAVWGGENEAGALLEGARKKGSRPLAGGPVVVIVTSLQDAARRQAAAVVASGALHFEPTSDELLDDTAWARWSTHAKEEFERARSTLLLTAPIDRSRKLPASLVPRRLAELTARIVAEGNVGGLVVTGGDGAHALFEALDATGFRLRDEIATGVPIGTLVGGPVDGMTVVTKAGGFGDTQALVLAVAAARGASYP